MRSMLVAFTLILASATLAMPAIAAKKNPCDTKLSACWSRCGRVYETAPRIEACNRRCDSGYAACLGKQGGTRAQ
jgi:hypothetical protein